MIADILPRLEKVRKTGPRNWLACCPAHEDRSPSFTIHEANDGRILAHCFGGCSFEEIVNAVGLGWDAWFPEKPIEQAGHIRAAFPAHDVLKALAFEATLVAVAAGNVAQGVELTEADRKRLFVAMQRINAGREMALGER